VTDTITIDEFNKAEMRAGKVVEAVDVEKSDKLIKLTVDLGEFGQRTIFTGVRLYGYTGKDFVNKQFFFVTNIPYRKMMGEESQGMILAVDGEERPFGEFGTTKPLFVSAEGMPLGAKIR
jgi:methionine--tRNA ligase beta chain